jgi:serine/threonine protein phosphatase PrpC
MCAHAYICAAAGDSRAVIINNAAAIQPVEDHAPTREDEQV